MNNLLKIIIPVILTYIFFIPSFSQIAIHVTLDQSIEMAISKGLVASDLASRYLAARKRAESAQRAGWTSVGLSVTAPSYSQSLTQQFNPLTGNYEYYQLQSTNYLGSLVVSQPLTLTGGTLLFTQSLTGQSQLSGLSGVNNTTNNYFGDFEIELQQPIFTGNQLRQNAERADIALQQAETDFLNNQLDLVYNVTESFYTLFQQLQRLAIVKEQVRQNEDSYKTAQSKFTGGLIPEVDALQSDVDLASSRNDSLTIERDVAQAKNNFRLLLGVLPQEDVFPEGDITYSPISIDSEKALSSALQYRPEALKAEMDIELREVDVASARTANNFRLDLNARYGANKTDTLLRDVFRGLNLSRSVSLTLSVPIFDWGRNGRTVEAAEIDYHNAKSQKDYVLQQVRQETMDLLERISIAESRNEVLQKSVAVAQQSYDISLQRFRNGTINSNELALVQQRLTAAKLNSLNALIDYKLGIADLRRKTRWDFEHNEPIKPVLHPDE